MVFSFKLFFPCVASLLSMQLEDIGSYFYVLQYFSIAVTVSSFKRN